MSASGSAESVFSAVFPIKGDPVFFKSIESEPSLNGMVVPNFEPWAKSHANVEMDKLYFININGKPVPVSGHKTIDIPKALASSHFNNWAKGLDPRFDISGILFQGLDMFSSRVGFVKFNVSATFQGTPVPGIVFARGGSVCVLVLLYCEGRIWVLCVRQARLAIGRYYLELPAGMMDGDGSFLGVAAKELEEEAGLKILPGDLVDMTELAYGTGTLCGPGGEEAAMSGGPPNGMYTTAGAVDEYMGMLLYRKNVSREYLDKLHGQLHGCAKENENIRLEIYPYETVWKHSPDSKTLGALALFERLNAEGKIRSLDP
jgi:ADP-sugar diphosphatase